MKIYFSTVGCRLNQSEIEKMAAQFRAAGHCVVDKAEEADLVVVNTCAVTSDAAADSRQEIRHAARVGHARVIATGCWATLDPAAAQALPGVERVVTNAEKDGLTAALLNLSEEELDPLERWPNPGDHSRTRAFIKAQDGCDNACTFCITHVARGRSRSRPAEAVITDIHRAQNAGVNEAVLTGVHLGSWGLDFEKPLHLRRLVEQVLESTSVARLRLSSLEPWDLDGVFFSLWQDKRLCPHLHLPLQSGSAAILRRMARKTTPQGFESLVQQAREAIPGVAITTDLIVGFPGEGEAEFEESRDFVRRMGFAGGHVFGYSARTGTAAARFSGQVPVEVRKQRGLSMRACFSDLAEVYRKSFIGQTLDVLWESSRPNADGSWTLEGLSSNYLRVRTCAETNLYNQISQVRLLDQDIDGVEGVVINSGYLTE